MEKIDDTTYDLVIIGGGPAGLTAAVYAGREGMNVLVTEKAVVGGMAAITDMIDNYPGFEEGITGPELSERLRKQAERFGAKIATGVTVSGVKRDEKTGLLEVAVADGEPLRARSVLVTTGSTYRKLGVPGEEALIGRGVSFCATCDGPMYRGRELVVVGGGNSAVQEALFLTKFASRIKLLVRSDVLRASAVLQDDLKHDDKIEVLFNTSITSMERVGPKLQLKTVDNVSGTAGEMETDGVFVFVGLLANTQPFVGSLDLDAQNFVVTDAHYQTSLPGVYAAGDVRSGATWQIASAVGEAAAATLTIREYLNELKRARR
jgi:thioredoxin reductase (NADPH)